MTRRDRTVIVVVAVVGIIAAAWMLVISPKRDLASKLGSQISKTQSSLNSARSELAQAQSARSTFRSSYTQLVRLGEAVPTDDDVPSLIFQIQSAANATGVDFGGLTLNTAGAAATTPAAPATGTPASASPTPTSATGASSTPTLPPGVSLGPAGFPVEPFNFTFQGNFFHLAKFFGRLERFVQTTSKRISVSGRLLTLEAISLTPSSSGFPQIQAAVSATTYLLPASQGLVEGATPSGPSQATAEPASTPSSSSSSSSAPPAAVVTGR